MTQHVAYRASDEIATLRAQRDELAAALRAILNCPEIADCAPEDKDPDTEIAERAARALLARVKGEG